MNRPQLIVFGHKQHGKDTACEYLRDSHGLSFASSSEFACQLFLYDQMKEEYGYTSMQECFNDRGNHRKYWYEEICRFNDVDRARLGKLIFAENNIYCGIRDLEEFEALNAEGLVQLSIFIDASERKPTESSESMKLDKSHADIIIENNGTLEELNAKLDRLARLIKK